MLCLDRLRKKQTKLSRTRTFDVCIRQVGYDRNCLAQRRRSRSLSHPPRHLDGRGRTFPPAPDTRRNSQSGGGFFSSEFRRASKCSGALQFRHSSLIRPCLTKTSARAAGRLPFGETAILGSAPEWRGRKFVVICCALGGAPSALLLAERPRLLSPLCQSGPPLACREATAPSG